MNIITPPFIKYIKKKNNTKHIKITEKIIRNFNMVLIAGVTNFSWYIIKIYWNFGHHQRYLPETVIKLSVTLRFSLFIGFHIKCSKIFRKSHSGHIQTAGDIIILNQTNIWSNSVRNGNKLTNKKYQNYSSSVTKLSLVARKIKMLNYLFTPLVTNLLIFFLL